MEVILRRKKLKFTLRVYKNCISDISGWRFFNIFLRFLGFSGSFSYINFSYKKRVVYRNYRKLNENSFD